MGIREGNPSSSPRPLPGPRPKKETGSKERIHLILPKSLVEDLDQLDPGSPSKTDTIRRALKFYIKCKGMSDNGDHLFATKADYVRADGDLPVKEVDVP